jgi:PIN domain nuclease of toxin-antitoxin system
LFKKIADSENYVLIPFDVPILKKMIGLKDIPELHDKMIVSTAQYLDCPLITKDKVLQNIPGLRVIW